MCSFYKIFIKNSFFIIIVIIIIIIITTNLNLSMRTISNIYNFKLYRIVYKLKTIPSLENKNNPIYNK